MRVIPKTAKVKVQFYKNVTVPDVIIALVGLVIEVLLITTEIEIFGKIAFMLLVFCPFVALYFPVDNQKFYLYLVHMMKYFFSVKEYNRDDERAQNHIKRLIPFKGLEEKYIVYNNYKAGVLEIGSREFSLLSEFRQNQIIDEYFGRVIRSINGNTRASIVKIDRKLFFDTYIDQEEEKRDDLYKQYEAGELTKKELAAREIVIDDRIRIYSELSENSEIEKPFYYLVVYDENENIIEEILNNAVTSLKECAIETKILKGRELGIFLKYNYTNNFDERDVGELSDDEFFDWIIPQSVKFNMKGSIVDGEESFTFDINNFPISVYNAWGYQLFNIPNTKVVMNLEPYDKVKAVKMLDRSLQELSSQADNAFKASSMLDKQTHIDTLVEVLRMLQNDNEILYKVNIHVTVFARGEDAETEAAKKNVRKTIKRILAEQGFGLSENFCVQSRAFVSSNISRYEAMEEFTRSIHSGSVAAVFPFVLSNIMDDRGVILGVQNNYPIILDFFKRNEERVNSNVVIMGKSGSGKSFSTKTLLSHLSAENCKIFILDPENEYQFLANNLGGRLIDVGTATQGRINPFHVITTLSSDEQESYDEGAVDNLAVHLQFLEEYFRVVLPGATTQVLEYLNNLVVAVYNEKGIDRTTDFSKLNADDYPLFDDLKKLIDERLEKATIAYDVENLRILSDYIAKFATGGRNANLWNGPSTLSVKENFCVFNFQSLLANKNDIIANSQMLLVLKWLDNEIIKNREFNIKHKTSRKIIVVIDEAHVFIDPKHPVALDFMYQLAKRIRKYNGMQVVITQNIKDFVGSPEIVRKSTAIINACQYSFIFALAPNDMGDLCTLYEKAGAINETEQDKIVNNPRGNAFVITSPTSRTDVEIFASPALQELFGEK